MIRNAIVAVCAVSMLWATGCSSSDTTAAAAPTCPSGTGTITFTLADVSPANGAAVPNQNIVQKFTIKDAPGLVRDFQPVLLTGHTAGTPANAAVSAMQVGKDIVYSITIDSWSTAPGHVQTGFVDRYQTSDGCIYAFPSPMFSYDVVSAGGTPSDAGAD